MVRVYTKKYGTNLIKPEYNDMRRANFDPCRSKVTPTPPKAPDHIFYIAKKVRTRTMDLRSVMQT